MSLLNEKTLRKPEWNESTGEWVMLADGQLWLFPKPVVRLRPTRVDGKITFTNAAMVTSFGTEFDTKVAALEDNENYVDKVFDLAEDMLARNYELTEDERIELFLWNVQIDPENGDPFIRTITSLARGINAPKPSTAGSDVLSSS